MKNKLLTFLLSLVVLSSLFPTAFAENNTSVAELLDSNENITRTFATTDELFTYLASNILEECILRLTDNVEYKYSSGTANRALINMGKEATLDLNGYTLTVTVESGTSVSGTIAAVCPGVNENYTSYMKNGSIIMNIASGSFSGYSYAVLRQTGAFEMKNVTIATSTGTSVTAGICLTTYNGAGELELTNCVIDVGTSGNAIYDEIYATYGSYAPTTGYGTVVISGGYVGLTVENCISLGTNSTALTNISSVSGTVIVSSTTSNVIVAESPSGNTVAYTYDSASEAAAAMSSLTNVAAVYSVSRGSGEPVLTAVETVNVGGSTYFVADEIEVEFVETSDENVYNINLVGADGTAIYRFLAAQLEFELTTDDAIGYEIAAADGISMTESGGVYEFNLTDSKAAETAASGENAGITDTSVTIGTVTFTGEGTFDFGIKSDDPDDTNKVQTAVYSSEDNNIVRTYVPDDTATTDVLDVSSGLENITISLEKSNLTVNVVFPNAVSDQSTDYTQMSVKITGLGQDGTPIALGATDSTGTDTNQKATGIAIGYTENGEETGSSLSDYNGYQLTDIEVYRGYSYQLEFTGDGYRTYRTTIVPTGEDASVTVWNNVMDSDMVVISQDDADSAVYKTTTFLAGDICMNGEIDLYDLSAVVSYFGKTGLGADDTTYIQYDLNRDGKIDSKDIAMVLVSWGK